VRENAQPGELRFDWDDLYRALTDAAPHERPLDLRAPLEQLRRGLAEHWAAALRESGAGGWIIASAARASTREYYRALGAEVVLLMPSAEECLGRANDAGRPAEWSDAIGRWFREFEPDGEKETNMDPNERPRTGTIERRSVPFMELRVAGGEDGKPAHIEGHAAVFEKLSLPLGGFRERIRKGAFAKTLQEADIRSLWNHDTNFVLGRTKSGTLELREDGKGLFFRVEPPDTQWARDLLVSVERGDIDQASFGFRAVKELWRNELDDKQDTIRELIEVELTDVSPVTFAAYPQTDIQVRSALAELGVDWDTVNAAVTRSQHGLELRQTDCEIIQGAIDALSRVLPGEPGQGPHSKGSHGEEEAQGRLAILRRRLDLAERSV
jgi:HK97 family phage prohead protease